jgi:hypothetical protein
VPIADISQKSSFQDERCCPQQRQNDEKTQRFVNGYVMHRGAAEGERVFDTPTGIAKFTLISLAATMVSATIGVSSLTLAGYAEMSSFISVWLTWGLGDLAGALVVTPVVVLWAKKTALLGNRGAMASHC